MANESKIAIRNSRALKLGEDPLDSYRYDGIEIVGDIMSPVVPDEYWISDENNLLPEEWAAKQAAKKQD